MSTVEVPAGPEPGEPLPNPRQLLESALRLLPDPGSSPRCASHTKEIGVDPGGTAFEAAVVLVIETPQPWPKPVFAHDFLRGTESAPMTALGPARILAAVPDGADNVGRVHAWWRQPNTGEVRSSVLRAGTNEELVALVSELATRTPDRSSFAVPEKAPERAVLICTQGSHDICCGTDGTRLAFVAEAHRPDVRFFRVSHTGGHRFAPTAMTLPDGRMWAYLDMVDLDGILTRSGDPARLARQCRGWWGAGMGPAQVAERAVFAELGWSADDARRHVVPIQHADDLWRFEVRCGGANEGEVFEVEVSRGRQVPTIACRTLGGMPAKPAWEYTVTAGPEARAAGDE